jgi:hypothetical protein
VETVVIKIKNERGLICTVLKLKMSTTENCIEEGRGIVSSDFL